MTDQSDEDDWIWASGESVTFTNWAPNEPNNNYSCGENWAIINWNSSGQWNDVGLCTQEYSGQAIVESEEPHHAIWTVNPSNSHSYTTINCGFWTDCENQAVSLGGHLATIRSQSEQNWITQTFGTSTKFWIGMTDQSDEDDWIWASGESVTFTNWAPNEPNNNYSCGENWAIINWNSSGQWNDVGLCTQEYSGQAIVESETAQPQQVHIALNSSAGSVASNEAIPLIHCNDQQDSVCTYDYPWQASITLTATPKTGYAFLKWRLDNLDIGYNQELEVSADQPLNLTAVFGYRTFRNAVGDFKVAYDPNNPAYYGECVPYVRYETEILQSACNGPAYQCFSQAQAQGYSTGATPMEGAIMVFNIDTSKNMPVGHVGIVKSINGNGTITLHDSNWCANDCQLVREHDVDPAAYNILGYIYYTP